MNREQLEEYFETLLERTALEDILETYDLGPLETLMHLFDQGLIQQDYPEYEQDGYENV